MDITKDIQPLAAFRTQAAAFARRLKATGRPIILTIDGKAAVVVQDAAAYQRLCDRAAQTDAASDVATDMPMSLDFDEMRRKLGLPS